MNSIQFFVNSSYTYYNVYGFLCIEYVVGNNEFRPKLGKLGKMANLDYSEQCTAIIYNCDNKFLAS